ncbi:NAD(P)/FAD-dependent oxidoreductase [Phreatobacter stygius]|uniref:FAD-dependent oxidoreductase n=1 Tax=Phreatobacter stygius TaxID=1940610 RepID=A0A4D7B7G4_9HYPH|nr:FAD-dependent monooxygenase [Phreatobacter stygius]QCI63837.1 FAD-dependent oxidoreductase [Phreatobacter stygius]
MRQVVVLGAGMAGMACARSLLQRGYRPLLVAPRGDVANHGETLSFHASSSLETLGWLGLLDEETALASQGRYSVWGGSALRRAEAASGWHIDRRRLELRMSAALEADGVERSVERARRLSRSPAQVAVELTDGSSIATEFVVDCSGRSAISSGAGAAPRRLHKMVAAFRIFRLDDDVEAAAATLVEAVATGWWYMALMPGRRIMVGLFSDSDLLPAGIRNDVTLWADMVSRTTAMSRRLSSLGLDPVMAADLHFAPASTVTASRLVEPRILRAGDAASALDPLGANGLATALWSGIQAAESVAGLLVRDDTAALRYERHFLEGIASHLATQTALYASEQRFPDMPFWQRRRGPML